MNSQFTFFSNQQRLAQLQKHNDFLWRLDKLVDWEAFRPLLDTIYDKERKSNAGRPPFDVVFMFKILVLQHLYNLSYNKMEGLILDRLSWMNFLGITIADAVPDENTIWLFAEQVKNHGLTEKLFDQFGEQLDNMGLEAKGGSIIDSSFVVVPRRRVSKEENEQIKKGEIPQSISSNPHRHSQTDTDAEWAKKGDDTFFGYKNHDVTDVEHNLIRGYGTTGASVHDVNLLTDLVSENPTPGNEEYYGDAGYTSADREAELQKRGYVPLICEKVPKKRPLLAQEVKENNRAKSKIRCRVEHAFGEMKMRMGDETMRLIGFGRAVYAIGMRNLVYNMSRSMSLVSPKRAKTGG